MTNFNFIRADGSQVTTSFDVLPVTYQIVNNNYIVTADPVSSSVSPASMSLATNVYKVENNLEATNTWYISVDTTGSIYSVSGSDFTNSGSLSTVTFNFETSNLVPFAVSTVSIQPIYTNVLYSSSFVLNDSILFTTNSSGSFTASLVPMPLKVTCYSKQKKTSFTIIPSGLNCNAKDVIVTSTMVSNAITPSNSATYGYTAQTSNAKYLPINWTASYAQDLVGFNIYSASVSSEIAAKQDQLTTGSTYNITASYAINADTASYVIGGSGSGVSGTTLISGSTYNITASYAQDLVGFNIYSASVSSEIAAKQDQLTTGSAYNITASVAETASNLVSTNDYTVHNVTASNLQIISPNNISSSIQFESAYATNAPSIAFYNKAYDTVGYNKHPARIYYGQDVINTLVQALYIEGGAHNNRIYIGSPSRTVYGLNLNNVQFVEQAPNITFLKSKGISWGTNGNVDNIVLGDGLGGISHTDVCVFNVYDAVNGGAWTFSGGNTNINYLTLFALSGSSYSGRLGLGTGNAIPDAKFHIIGTTEQLRIGYDTSNYLSTTVASNGSTTYNLTGTSPEFTFNQKINGTITNADTASYCSIQAGRATISSGTAVTVTLATAYANTNYSVTAIVSNGSNGYVTVSNKTPSSFLLTVNTGGIISIDWQTVTFTQ